MGYVREGNVFETLPEDWPTFSTAGPTHFAYGIPACAGMLMELGDVHVNTDDGFGSSSFIPSSAAYRIAEEIRRLGGNPDDYRALRHRLEV